MEGNVQAEASKNKTEAAVENEHVSKKLKLSEPIDKDSVLDNHISKNESKDIEMPVAQENQPQSSCSKNSKQKIPETNKKISGGKKACDSDDDCELPTEVPTEGFNFPLEQDASDMLNEVDGVVDGRFLTVTERYFTPYYQLDITQPGDDVCILVHSNRICMFTLAPSHIIHQENKKIVKCDYQVSEKLNRLNNKVSGKAKHGAQPLQNNSNLCRLTCEDGSVYVVKCCIIGKLVEVNERLVDDPELLKQQPHDGGYLAIALPNLKHLENIKSKLLDQKSYEQALKARKEKIEKEKNSTSDSTLAVEDKEEIKNNGNNDTESVEFKEDKAIVNINDTKVNAMEIVES